MKRDGFLLLEVILALAILTGAMAVLGELARLGLLNARIARDTTQAQLLCESKLAELTARITPAQTVSDAKFEEPVGDGSIDWIYSIDLEATDLEGLVAVRVTVMQDMAENQRPVQFSLVRWMPDPDVELSSESETEAAENGF